VRGKWLLPGLLTAALLWPSCHRRTEEDVIIETIDRLVHLAERKDLGAILALIAEDFADFEGRDKAGLHALLASYYEGRTGIVAHRLSTRVSALEADRATVEADVALSSGGAEALRRLIRFSPDVYRIRIDLSMIGGSWLVCSAEWSPIGLDGLLPESLVQLKKIFPRLWTDK
jgi:hypothetical protein